MTLPPRATADPHAWIDVFRGQMLRFATLQLGQPEAAQDAVQEAIAAALAKRGALEDSAAFKQWVFGILKHKIVDTIRSRARLTHFPEADDPDMMDACFTPNGEWTAQALPAAWAAPDEAMQSKQFWLVFSTCLERLPPANARVFMMREYLEFDAVEICERLSLTPGALHIAMHRARLRLRSCLELNWFADRGGRKC
ncbi:MULTISPECIES: sigma-70 family RNA polymerase sigma factor [Achromobacter]|uniref:Sigma-70 family RNA polymerase sigma factor n=1 Tax=Achromobacter spanius TaxID=217203 RepID=A0ABY8GNR5_9BURK|nr:MULTISPECIES: sigma-70 family RNA polymerase sigma factor [Achromobacter]WAI84538.1 sigma-70 family RNA polymerase sigma factor [Achromobacter spanius]WEX94622.1 sigma-70 family RNA polymerase sigma factor [Achromobacter sp. SS2-2022]WFP06214.1 sigma-70 family RNA polymerase sigma factor [Achromobacter spanius]